MQRTSKDSDEQLISYIFDIFTKYQPIIRKE